MFNDTKLDSCQLIPSLVVLSETPKSRGLLIPSPPPTSREPITRLHIRNQNENVELNSDYRVLWCLLNMEESKKQWGPHKFWNSIPCIGGIGFPRYKW